MTDQQVLTPKPAFVIKTFKCGADGKPTEDKVFINVCALDAVAPPQTRTGEEVNERILDDCGIDNLQVPIHVGPMWEDKDHKGDVCTVTDVVFNPCITTRCANGTLQQHYHRRVADLSMQFVEEEHSDKGLKLHRQFKIPKMTYKGKGTPKPVMIQEQRMPLKAKVTKTVDAEEEKELVQEIKPVEEEPIIEITGGAASAKAANKPEPAIKKEPVIKKGFFNNKNTKPLYPNGSEEGVLPENAGDPLGYLPKNLRKSCKIVDPTGEYYKDPKIEEAKRKRNEERTQFEKELAESAKHTDPEEFMSKLAEIGHIMFPETRDPAAAPKPKPDPDATAKAMFEGTGYHGPSMADMENEFLDGICKSAPAIRTLADLGLKPFDEPAKKAEEPPEEDTKPKEETDPMAEVIKKKPKANTDNSIWGNDEVAAPAAPTAPEATSPAAQTKAPEAPKPAAVVTPEHTLETIEGGVRLTVQLPELENMSGVDLNVQPTSLELTSAGYHLVVDFGCTVDEEECKAKFNKKRRQLQVALPTV